jgi:hypothetical protein
MGPRRRNRQVIHSGTSSVRGGPQHEQEGQKLTHTGEPYTMADVSRKMAESEQRSIFDDSLRTYEDVIAGFERARERMLERKRNAVADTPHLDDSLALNARTLESLKRAYTAAKQVAEAAQTGGAGGNDRKV